MVVNTIIFSVSFMIPYMLYVVKKYNITEVAVGIDRVEGKHAVSVQLYS